MSARTFRPDDAFVTKAGALTDQARRYLRSVTPATVGTNGQVLVIGADGVPTPVSVSSILPQVVQATTTTPASSSSSTYATTGLSGAITLTAAGSRVRVRVSVNGLLKDTNDTGIGLRIRRSSTTVAQIAVNAGKTGTATTNRPGSVSAEVEDTPGSVGPHTYTVEFASVANAASVTVQESNAVSTMTLTEVF